MDITEEEFTKAMENKEKFMSGISSIITSDRVKMELEECDQIEEWLASATEVTDERRTSILLFFGETIINVLGGKWEYCNDPKQVDYLSPVIIDYAGFNGFPLNPGGLIRVCMKKKRTGLVRATVEFLLNKPEVMQEVRERLKKA